MLSRLIQRLGGQAFDFGAGQFLCWSLRDYLQQMLPEDRVILLSITCQLQDRLIVAKGHIMIATLQKVSLVTGAAQFQALFDALSKVVGEAMVHAQIVAIGCS